jgi:tol-pal system protein YbgF
VIVRRAALVAVAWALSGCLATRADLRVLQADIAVVRAEHARSDSVRAKQVAEILQTIRASQDSMRGLGNRLAKWQGDQKEDMYAVQQKLLTILELTGLSQRRLMELRANLEDRAPDAGTALQPGGVTPSPLPASGGAASSPTPGAAGAGATTAGAGTASPPAAPSGPGPNQLLQLALDQLRRGSAGSARAGFQDLVTQYPTADIAPLAQFYVAESWAQEGKAAAADSVYQLVVAKYPQSEKAATALYKHGLHLLTLGKRAESRAVFQDVVKRFPRSDEAVLAAARVRDGG